MKRQLSTKYISNLRTKNQIYLLSFSHKSIRLNIEVVLEGIFPSIKIDDEGIEVILESANIYKPVLFSILSYDFLFIKLYLRYINPHLSNLCKFVSLTTFSISILLALGTRTLVEFLQ